MSVPTGWSRRRVLQAGGALIAGAVAGCSGTGNGTPTPDGSVFRRITFDGPDLVVELEADHGVSAVNLVGPDGSTVAREDVVTGATTVRLQILDIQPGPGFGHYTPGVNELVAVLEDRTESVDLELRPDLRVTAIESYHEGNQPSGAGRLAVTVENVGTGPTWVYEVTYRGAPNENANDELGDDPGITPLAVPDRRNELILEPGTQRAFVGASHPLVFLGEDERRCSGSVEFTVIIGTAIGDPLERTIRATLGGDVTSAGLTGEYTCSEVAVELLDGGTSG